MDREICLRGEFLSLFADFGNKLHLSLDLIPTDGVCIHKSDVVLVSIIIHLAVRFSEENSNSRGSKVKRTVLRQGDILEMGFKQS